MRVVFASIGVIGSGPVGQALARHASAAGFPVLVSNTRGPLSLAGLVSELGPTARAVKPRQAALADLVIIAIPFVRIPELAAEIGDCSGRVVVDATNQFATYQPYSGYVDLGEQTGTEWVAAHLPGATMIKAFNAMFASYLRPDPRHPEGRQVVFFAGDDDGASTQFAAFVDRMGFAPVYIGGVRDGGRLLQLGGPLSGLHVLNQD
jgi:8-hydroxy-5-deazaflavin:NADPH oxidoreductase